MEFIFHHSFLDHLTGHHPECPARLHAFTDLPDADLPDGREYLPYAHEATYVEMIEKSSLISVDAGPETFTSPGTYQAAVNAVAATIKAMETGGFALVRPPGHHAYPARSSGFCIFNNIAIAASFAASAGKRVLIFDFDGHLGDGTSKIFDGSDQVLYWSIHQYPAYPGHGYVDEIGVGSGKGYTLNMPIPPGSGDDIFWHAFERYLPFAQAFKPEVVAISAGFDGYKYDPLLDLNYSLGLFYKLGQTLKQIFPQSFATLEGGYNLEILHQCIYNFRDGFNGKSCPFPDQPTTSGSRIWEEYDIRLHAGIFSLTPYWDLS
jgi:acetoin utilization deacetylase AcuC-like enzyme